LKIPKLLSQSIGYYLNIKQILDVKNNLSIVEKINQLKNLIKCMRNKIETVEKVERKKKQMKGLFNNRNIGKIINNNLIFILLYRINNIKT
jgi:hypothetical protein